MRVSRRTVGRILERVAARLQPKGRRAERDTVTGTPQGAIAVNPRIRLLTRRAFCLHSWKPPMALAMLSFGGFRASRAGARNV